MTTHGTFTLMKNTHNKAADNTLIIQAAAQINYRVTRLII
jgi:hypothetical protein